MSAALWSTVAQGFSYFVFCKESEVCLSSTFFDLISFLTKDFFCPNVVIVVVPLFCLIRLLKCNVTFEFIFLTF